jgi:hypothetical protein
MKMHILAVAVLAALASRPSLAASEGGDTWSAVTPTGQSPTSLLQRDPRGEPTASSYEVGGSEGGDTWSDVQIQYATSVQQAGAEGRADWRNAEFTAQIGASEGGDTWSRFTTQPEGRLTSTAGISSKPAL